MDVPDGALLSCIELCGSKENIIVSEEEENPTNSDKDERGETIKTKTAIYDEYYNMNFKHNGYILIFLHKDFKIGKYNKRTIINEDLHNLTECFEKKLNFVKKVCYDSTEAEIIKILEKTANMNTNKYATLAVVVSTHGKSKSELAAKDCVYSQEKLWKPFEKSSSWAGKPKLFLIQACRGDKKDTGYLLQSTSTADTNKTIKAKTKDTEDVRLEKEADYSNPDYNLPKTADFLIYNSSFPGYISYNRKNVGSIFLMCLCLQLTKEGQTKDFLTNTTIINHRICTEYETYHDDPSETLKQCPIVATTLIRKLIFK